MTGIKTISTPIGNLTVEAGEQGIQRIHFPGDFSPEKGEHKKTNFKIQHILSDTVNQLQEYFSGKRKTFNLPMELKGLPPYHAETLKEVSKVSYGETASYGEIANRTGNPGAARAVGNANARNPIPIIIPCHRIIAANGGLGGYGGRLDRKEFLLRLEGAI